MAQSKLCKTSPPTLSTPSSKVLAFIIQSLCLHPGQPSAYPAPLNAMWVAASPNRFLSSCGGLFLAFLLSAIAIHPAIPDAKPNDPGQSLKLEFESAKADRAAGFSWPFFCPQSLSTPQ